MDLRKIEDKIRFEEGCRFKCYADLMGIKTVGIGHNLQTSDSPALLTSLGLDYDKVCSGEQELTQDQVDQIFQHDLNICAQALNIHFPNFEDLPENAQIVLYDLLFNLGNTRFSQFVHFIACVQVQNWYGAVTNLENSLWARQLPARCKRDCLLLEQI